MVGSRLISFAWRLVFLIWAVVLGSVAGCQIAHALWSQACASFALALACLFCRWHAGRYL